MAFEFNVTEKGIILANSHRGYSAKYPENTMPAFIGALEAGTHSIELDIAMTKDEKIVVIHDFSIERVSNGEGYVEQMTLAELQQYDFGEKFSPAFKGTHIVELETVLKWAQENNVGLIVEAKQRRNHQRFAEVLAEILQRTNTVDQILLLGFDHVLINKVKALLPALRLQVVTLARYNDQLSAVLGSNASSVCVEYHYVGKEDLIAYKKAGLSVRMYLHESKEMPVLAMYNQKYGYDTESEIIQWLREGLIDMLSHDDIPYLKSLIEKAGKTPY
ncbi:MULTISPECIES: glycerophosphodiester phosphodiesterase [unclassified Avibacterium]|uniref:glycerophosphodiester phosphodiesterase n=1 Tax=unclassified Avibacterium TaxID=2685287 RepID=UPI0020272B46|nr:MULTISPECIES: glycerophosphodiester phosphodiesterase family protein [unclassified Avibacterium]MCW9717021.1 glycerophosphodiester phosphodiesterase [Avibacterium sp. 21-599]MCW9732339.1 glycerophosphodiester phosphodiesterase [Avibacterium sp. 20-15]URL02574.1 glycerophosphodiester phosphodiesterase [Avibacterium sp. 20-126]URL04506.1 glycerophosphodiester phosphodiesterase [Avibacterium sp. 20-132]